ncbi:adenine deaminase [Alkalihalobacillus oceani]|uniref:Adenine deaminase n=1 Tax=Halalkalibacter oceani TaxID=1653776 RepID=A0A9X2DU48_9BACI|nr:adenine deaminase [Halalkalibacter oceani]MCM3715525.1 adenine deaminase [Halalkalibacter oceani]
MKQTLKQKLAAATKREKAELVIKNGIIIDVFSLTTYEADVAITGGVIVGVGSYEGEVEIDAAGAFLVPSFIDGHVHIESATVTPEEFAKVVLPHGVTTVMADPHELANVGGKEAVRYMLEAAKDLPLDIHIMVPSCVPAASFEHNGATLTAKEVEELFDEDQAYGLAEVMDYPAVFAGEEEMVAKLEAARKRQKGIDGHAAGLDGDGLNAYRVAGISNDHEAVTAAEAEERIRRGMYILIREGTAAKDLEALLPAVTTANARRCVFATDDKHLDDLIDEGSIDASVRKAVSLGLDPLQAIQMATLNAAECFGLREKGAIAPGYEASLLFLRDLKTLDIERVYVKGELIAEKGELKTVLREPIAPPDFLLHSINVKPLADDAFALPVREEVQPVIGVTPGSIVTKHLREPVASRDGLFQPSVANNQLKLVVAERHRALGHVGVGIVKGIPLKKGAMAATIAHDSHNIVACGADDASIRTAIEQLIRMNGGMVLAEGESLIAGLPLPLGGLMSIAPYEEVYRSIKTLDAGLKELGVEEGWNPFLTLSFLALPVIPALKLTDCGLFDVEAFRHL